MKPEDAEHQFEQFLEESNLAADALTPRSGLAAMLDFYVRERADGCSLAEDGDMLLFQWGTYDWGDGLRFEVGITRQLSWPERRRRRGELELWQLALTFRFPPIPRRRRSAAAIAGATRPTSLAAFKSWIEATPVFAAFADRRGAEVSLTYDSAE